jgi:hypothetical protein
MQLTGSVSTQNCESLCTAMDRCSVIYVAILGVDHRPPQSMQSHGDAWVISTAALLGAVIVDLVVLGVLWAWRYHQRGTAPRIGTAGESG